MTVNVSDGDENKPKKSKPQKKPGRKITTAQKIKNLDENVIKQVLKDKKEEMTIEASKIAKEMAARMDLAIDVDTLSEQQQQCALLYASGYSITEIAEKEGITENTFKGWMKNSAFMKSVNENLFSEGLVSKNERIRAEKRMLEDIKEAIFEKTADKENLGSLSLPTLFKLWQDLNVGFSKKVDEEKDDKGPRDISVQIIQYFKSEKNKDYDDLDAFLDDQSFNFNKFIDIKSEEVSNDN